MKRLGSLIVLALLSGCVASQYHANGPTTDSVIVANKSCAYVYAATDRQYASGYGIMPVVGGLAGGVALATVEGQSPERISADQQFNTCMARHGWARN